MSREVEVLFEIRSMPIMRDTLARMNLNYSESKEEILTIQRPYHNIVINGKTGQISYDESYEWDIDNIRRNYSVNWYKDELIREGNEIREEVLPNGEIHIHVNS